MRRAAYAVLAVAAAAAAASALVPHAHASEHPPSSHVFNATGTVTAAGYKGQGGPISVHGIQVCAHDLTNKTMQSLQERGFQCGDQACGDGPTAGGAGADEAAGAAVLTRLNTTSGAPACGYTDKSGEYRISGVVGSDPHDETRADVVIAVLSRGHGGAVTVVGHGAGGHYHYRQHDGAVLSSIYWPAKFHLYRAVSDVAVDYDGVLHAADFALPSPPPRYSLGKFTFWDESAGAWVRYPGYGYTPPAPGADGPPMHDAPVPSGGTGYTPPAPGVGIAGAARIISALSDGMAFFEEHGREPPDLAVWWPHHGWSASFPDEPDGPDGGGGGLYPPDAAVMRLDRSRQIDESYWRYTILYEMALRVLAAPGHDHGPRCDADPLDLSYADKGDEACAWSEGLAILAPHLIDGKATMHHLSAQSDIESATVTVDGYAYLLFPSFEADGRAIGEKVPGRVAAAMWDMADSSTDAGFDSRPAAGGRDDVAAGTGRLLGVLFNGTYGSFAEFYDRWEIDMRHYSAERVARLHGMSFAIPNTVPYYRPAGEVGGLFGSGLAGLDLIPNHVAVSGDGSIVAVTSERGRGLQLVDVSGGADAGSAGAGAVGRHIGLYAARGHDYACMLERDVDACLGNPEAFGLGGPAPGHFSSMDGVAFSPDGEILLVTDGHWNRILMFGPDGGYVGQFGNPHPTTWHPGDFAGLKLEGDNGFECAALWSGHGGYRGCARTPPPPERPVGASGEFYRLSGVAFLPDGKVAAADAGNRRIRLLELGGDGGAALPVGQFTSYSPLHLGAMLAAQHLAVGPEGNIYAAGGETTFESTAAKIWRYTLGPNGTGALRIDDASLEMPGGIAVGSDGLVYVSDRERGRIRTYNMSSPWTPYESGRELAVGPYDPLNLRSDHVEHSQAPAAPAPGPHAAPAAPAPGPHAAPALSAPRVGTLLESPSHLGALPLEVRLVPPYHGEFVEEEDDIWLCPPLGWLTWPLCYADAFVEEFGSLHGPQPLAAPGGIALGPPDSATGDARMYVADPNGVMIYERDRERPAVTRVWAHTPDGTVRPGGTAEIAVSFSERVTVSGKPALPLVAGADAARGAVYASGSGSHTLTFNYTAGAGDGPGYLDNAGAGLLALAESGGASIMDGSGNAADPALPARGTAASLAANAALWIAPGGGRAAPAPGDAGPFGIEPVPPVSATEGREVRLAINTTAPPGPFSLSGAPPGAAILPNGTLLWTPGEAQDGDHAFVVGAASAADPGSAHARTVRIAVSEANEPPRIAPIPDMRAAELSELRFDVGAADPDIPAQRLKYDVGAGAPPGATILPNGTFAWTPSARAAGVHEFNVSVSDGLGPGAGEGGQGAPGTAFASFSVKVADVPQPPLSVVRVYEAGPPRASGSTRISWTPSSASEVYEAGPPRASGSGVAAAAGGGEYSCERILGCVPPKVWTPAAGGGAHAGLPGWRALGLPSAYGAGDEITIAVEFSAPALAMRGPPELRLDAGAGPPAVAAYDSGNGTSVLRFKYTVDHGHDTGRLAYRGPEALSAAAGGWFEAAASGEAAVPVLPAPGSAGSLSSTSGITVATTSPVVDIGVLDDRAPAGATAHAAWMAAADFNARSGGPLLNVTVHQYSDHVSGREFHYSDRGLRNVTVHQYPGPGAAETLRRAHAGGAGPDLYVGRLGDRYLHGAMPYAAEHGIVLVSTDSSAPSLAVEGDRTFRLRPSDGLQAGVLVLLARNAGAESMYAVLENSTYGPGRLEAQPPQGRFSHGFAEALASASASAAPRLGGTVVMEGADAADAAAAAAAALDEAVRSGGSDSGPAAVVYLGSPRGLAALAAAAAAAYPDLRSAIWLASDLSAGSGLLVDGSGPAAEFAAQVGLRAVQWSQSEGRLAREIDSRLPDHVPGTLRQAHAAYDAVRVIGAAAAAAAASAAAGGTAAADTVAASAIADRLPAAAAAYAGALGDIALDPAGDLWNPAGYDVWEVVPAGPGGSAPGAPGAAAWVRHQAALDEARSCSITLEKAKIDYGPIDPGQTSRPHLQTITNTGQLPFSGVDVVATPWHVDSPGTCAAGGRPSLPAGLSEIRTELGGEFTDLSDGTTVARGLEAGGQAPLWYRLNLADMADAPRAEISQCVTYVVRCG